jgi:pimeloyl-ACP methyl ester carboxylesterase
VKVEELRKAPASSWLATFIAVQVAVVAVGAAALLKFPVEPVAIVQTAPFVTLTDGRNLSYSLRGDPAATYTVLYLHRSASSRLEAALFDEGVLREHSARVLAVDRPGHGESSPHPTRNLTTFAADVEEVAAALGLHRLLVVGSSVGATYALALAALLPDRVQATLLISPSGSTGDLGAAEFAELKADANFPGSRYPVNGLLRRVGQHPRGAALLKMLAQAPLGGRLLYEFHLAPIVSNVTTKLDPADRACILSTKPQVTAAYKEGLYQKTAGPWMEDVTTTLQPLPFNLSQVLPAEAQGRISILASRRDTTVPDVFAKSLKRRLPGVSLRSLDVPGHMGFFTCHPAWQRQLLGEMLAASCVDDPAVSGCVGWAAAGECSNNPTFMLKTCKKSCGTCHFTQPDIDRVVATPCEDSNDGCPGWATQGECEKNPVFMWGDNKGPGQCRKSCKRCHALIA